MQYLYYMKKLFMVAIILMVGVSAAMAQKDVKAVGLNLNYGSEIKNVGIGAKFQYGITDAVRGEASFNYLLEKDGLKMWDGNVTAKQACESYASTFQAFLDEMRANLGG